MKIFEPFDQIRIINLPNRNDRRRGMDRELIKAGLAGDPRVEYFEAIRPSEAGPFTSIGAHGVYESQLSILRQAVMARESVLILEDDCAFEPDVSEREIEAGWEIFYGGYTAKSLGPLEEADIEGAHMMGFTASGARMVTEYLDTLQYAGVHPPIDAAYVWFRRAHPTVPTLFAVPPIAGQRPSRSDIAYLKWYDRLPILRQICNAVRYFRIYQ